MQPTDEIKSFAVGIDSALPDSAIGEHFLADVFSRIHGSSLMHSAMLANLASTIALHSPALLNQSASIPAGALQDYWIASRKRCGRWHALMAIHNEYESRGDGIGMRSWWEKHDAVLEEILISEILARVYAAIAAGIDRNLEEPEVGPVVHSVYLSHLEARNRALRMVLSARGAATETLARLNRLRQTCERWIDVLIGQVAAQHADAVSYAIVLERAAEYAEEAQRHNAGNQKTAGWLLAASMQDSLLRKASTNAPCAEENQKLADSVLVCLRPDLFDACGSLQSLWLYRLQHLTEETDAVIRELLSPQDSNSAAVDFETLRSPQFQKRLR